MRKVYLFSFLLISGLFLSQIVPHLLGENFGLFKILLDALLYTSLAFIMINVGREFEINKKEWRSYVTDYLVAMGAAALPWIFVALYYLFFIAPAHMQIWSSGDAWKETFLLTRFAAPTSAGILFTMLIAAGLKHTWVYKKVQVLAIFDDLDTILLMIPLQILMIGMRWQMFVVLIVALLLVWFGWRKMKSYNPPQDVKSILAYSFIIYTIIEVTHQVSIYLFGKGGAIHIEILLPAFILGMVMRSNHNEPLNRAEALSHSKSEKLSGAISYLFMLLVGMSMPLFVGIDFDSLSAASSSVISNIPFPSWGTIAIHVVAVTAISNIGKLFPLLFYREHSFAERLAVSVGMFARGEVGAGVLFIAIGYQLGGVLLIVSVLAMSLNFLLTGFFISYAKRLTNNSIKAKAPNLSLTRGQ
ncbi:MAG: sodium:proton antiporter [Bacteroidales bacterium]